MTTRLLTLIVGGPPRSFGKVYFVVTLLGIAFAVYVLALGEEPPLLRLFAPCMGIGVTLLGLGGLLYRWRKTLADLLRLAGVLAINLGLILFIVGLWQERQWEWFWSALIGYTIVFILMAFSVFSEWSRSERDTSSPEHPGPRG
jgi:peptidoglycan/LPS O-acetylase OafA/YrhL